MIEEAQSRDFLFWIETYKPATLLVSTRAPAVARAAVAEIAVKGSLGSFDETYLKVIRTVNPHAKSERYVALKLFQAILRGAHYWSDPGWFIKVPHRQWLISLLESERDVIDTLIRHGDSIESLLWGKLFDDLRLFAMSDRVFLSALERDKRNVYLLHARARMLGLWAQYGRGKYEQAMAAFSAAARSAPDNPYVWQSWGVMQHELRNYGEARGLFRDALTRASTAAEKVYVYVAWANLELESGEDKYQLAENLLAQAEQVAPAGSHVLVTRAKAAFYEGRYSSDDPSQMTARDYLLQALDLSPSNLAVLNMMGNMALKRGHWEEAEKWLKKALGVDPENIESHHSLAELEGEKAELHLRLRAADEALTYNYHSEHRFRYLMNDLGDTSLHTLVASGVCLARKAKIEAILQNRHAAEESAKEAGDMFERALAVDPLNRWALHSRAMILRVRGEKADAERLLKRILIQDPRNIPSLVSLARWKIEDGPEDEGRMIVEQIEKVALERQKSRIALARHEVIRSLNACAALWVELKDVSRALAISDRALVLDKENAYTLRARAEILYSAGRAGDADDLIETARKLSGE
jgi:tetratricopeptide (TPR) repeat protein